MFHREIDPLESFRGRKVTVMGLGLFGGGRGVTEFLCERGAVVTVTDRRPPEDLAEAVAALEHLPIRWRLGRHEEADFRDADLVVPSPAVPRDAQLLAGCRRRGVPLDTEMNLFFKYCRGRICGVTGTNGKTTTTSLLGRILSAEWPSTRVGGNLGCSLLPRVTTIRPEDWIVLELSSFQLEDLAPLARRPEVSVVTNVSRNHLDRHGTYSAYCLSKREILRPGPHPNVAVLNAEDAAVRSWETSRDVVYFGRTGSVRPRASGVWADSETGEVRLRDRGGDETPLFVRDDLVLPGTFNLLNAAAAAAAAASIGVSAERICSSIRSFETVEHRLEPFHSAGGVRYLNDSIATTPESTVAALEALPGGIVLICGGAAGGERSYRRLGLAIARRTRATILIGETADEIEREIPRRPGGPMIARAENLETAVRAANAAARPGDAIVLSPAAASYDMFVNFEARGRRFKELARGR